MRFRFELNRKENHYEDYTHKRRDIKVTPRSPIVIIFFFPLKHVFSFNEFLYFTSFFFFFGYFVLILYVTLSRFSSIFPFNPLIKHEENRQETIFID